MHILFMAGRELTYQRNDVLLRAFHHFGQIEVIQNKFLSHSLIWNSFWIGLSALPKLLAKKYDLIFVGFYGHLLMIPVGIIARIRRIPVLFDVFVSNYDTLVQDRQTISPNSFVAPLAIWLDKTACKLANHLLLDTSLHVNFFVQMYQLPPEKFSVVPVGCNEEIFKRMETPENLTLPEEIKVLYYCTYLPLHGADIVVQAAKQLKDKPIHFHLVGKGQEYENVQVQADGLNNIKFSPFLPLKSLRDEIADADVCLGGHFGVSDKAGRVIPGKIYQILAMERPLIASDSPANRTLLAHGKNAILIPPGNPEALANAISWLHQNPIQRNKISQEGYSVYTAQCSEKVITEKLREIINALE